MSVDERTGECDMEERQYTVTIEVTVTEPNLDWAITNHGAAAAVLGIEVQEEEDA